MKIVREIHDFIAGGSIVAPVGVALSIAASYLIPSAAPTARAATFFLILAGTFVASAYERE